MIRAVALLMLLAAGVGLMYSRAAAASVDEGGEGGGFDIAGMVASWTSTVFNPGQVAPAYGETVAGFAEYNAAAGVLTEGEMEQNLQAFLLMIRTAEGTAGANGYRTMFGGGLFDSFADHPRIKNTATFKGGKTVTSTAAGAYQFLATTWDEAARALGLPDFSPASQDAAAVFLIKRRGALDAVTHGRFDEAVRKVAKEWASLPGSPYGQPTITAERARELYSNNGGVFA